MSSFDSILLACASFMFTKATKMSHRDILGQVTCSGLRGPGRVYWAWVRGSA